MTEIVKRAGWDWDVTYLDEDADGREITEVMTVFGAATIEEAIRDARGSFEDEFMPAIISAARR